jgi:thymidylate synthase ThyX
MTTVKILADTRGLHETRLTTFLVKFPRFIEPEILRHRSLSFSAASSRAINLEKHIDKVDKEYFIPKFTKDNKGMSAKERLSGQEEGWATLAWGIALNEVINASKELLKWGVHKQHGSRLLQPFEYQEMIISGTEWESFFELRCPKYYIPGVDGEVYRSKLDVQLIVDKYNLAGFNSEKDNKSEAQPEIQELAEIMWDLYNLNTPNISRVHLPFGYNDKYSVEENIARNVAQCARISYLSEVDNIEKDLLLYSKLKGSQHWSPFEHVAFAMDTEDWYDFGVTTKVKDSVYTQNGWCKNFRGFVQLRFLEELNLDYSEIYGI